jgi:hypothetical protein
MKIPRTDKLSMKYEFLQQFDHLFRCKSIQHISFEMQIFNFNPEEVSLESINYNCTFKQLKL